MHSASELRATSGFLWKWRCRDIILKCLKDGRSIIPQTVFGELQAEGTPTKVREGGLALSQITENRKVETRKSFIFNALFSDSASKRQFVTEPFSMLRGCDTQCRKPSLRQRIVSNSPKTPPLEISGVHVPAYVS